MQIENCKLNIKYLFNYHFNLPNIYIKHLEIVSNKVHECDRHLHILFGIYDRWIYQNYYQIHYYLDQNILFKQT